MIKNTYMYYELYFPFFMNLERAPPTADDPKLTDRWLIRLVTAFWA